VVGDAALLVDPYDEEDVASAMRRAATDDALRLALREKGMGRAAEFTWLRTAELTLASYQAALDM